MKAIAIALVLAIAGLAVADRHDEIAARALAEAIHRPRASEFIPDKKSECLCTIGGFCRCTDCKCEADVARRRPTVIDSHDVRGERTVKKKAAPKKKAVVRRQVVEPVYYSMPQTMFSPAPVFGGFGGGGACGPGG